MNPALITRQINANRAATKWREQYLTNGKWGTTMTGDTEPTYKRLVALGESPNPDDVDAVIGNDAWTSVGSCHQCDKRQEILVTVGEEPDYESDTANLCIKCLKAALSLALEESRKQ